MTWWHVLQHWLAVHTGTVNEGGPYYGFFSGFGSDLGEVTIIGAIIATFKHHNCGVKRCWRIGKIPVEGTPHKTCHKHSTVAHHKTLHERHGREHPEQHELLNPVEVVNTPAARKVPVKRATKAATKS